MKLISLFAGIGAVEMGAYRVYDDVEIIAAAEIDKFARKSYIANHNINLDHFYTDIRYMDGTKYKGMADVVSFGFPCQDYSIAGKRAGLEGQRGTLFYEGARIVKESMPPVFIAENVKGLLSSNGGKDYNTIMSILRDELGYYVHACVLNTKDYGVPQNRERIFLVGFLDHDHYHRFQFAPKVPLEKRLKDVLETEIDDKYYIDHKKFNYDGGDQLNHEYSSQANTVYETDGIAPTLCAFTHGYAQGYIKCENGRIRKFTPREFLRLQYFQETFKQVVSDSQLYKQAGNSMSVNVLEMIFRQIEKALKNEPTGTLFDFQHGYTK